MATLPLLAIVCTVEKAHRQNRNYLFDRPIILRHKRSCKFCSTFRMYANTSLQQHLGNQYHSKLSKGVLERQPLYMCIHLYVLLILELFSGLSRVI